MAGRWWRCTLDAPGSTSLQLMPCRSDVAHAVSNALALSSPLTLSQKTGPARRSARSHPVHKSSPGVMHQTCGKRPSQRVQSPILPTMAHRRISQISSICFMLFDDVHDVS